jgi:speckle-type POZ protein
MDCCLCSSVGNSYRPPRNTVCVSCYDGAKAIIDLCRKLEQEWRDDGEDGEKARQAGSYGLHFAYKQIKQLEQMEENVSEKLEFLESLVEAFQMEMHTDVELITNDGLSIHAHRVVMVSSFFSLSFSGLNAFLSCTKCWMLLYLESLCLSINEASLHPPLH